MNKRDELKKMEAPKMAPDKDGAAVSVGAIVEFKTVQWGVKEIERHGYADGKTYDHLILERNDPSSWMMGHWTVWAKPDEVVLLSAVAVIDYDYTGTATTVAGG